MARKTIIDTKAKTNNKLKRKRGRQNFSKIKPENQQSNHFEQNSGYNTKSKSSEK